MICQEEMRDALGMCSFQEHFQLQGEMQQCWHTTIQVLLYFFVVEEGKDAEVRFLSGHVTAKTEDGGFRET